jgi:D-glycero-beta-D-manno-heptose-7-phosphate kinase
LSPGRKSRKANLPGGPRKALEASVDLTRLLEIVSAFPSRTICVIGDLVLDEFVSGEISRVSREAPVLILRHRRSEAFLGGGANAANNIADLGGRVIPIGIVGDDAAGQKLLELFASKRVDTRAIVRVRGCPTTTKTRYLAGWTHTTEQQVLRVDHEPRAPLPESVERAIERRARQIAGRADAVLISDYGFAVAPPKLVRKLKAKLLTLDSRYRLREFRGAGVTAATPNEAEIEAAYGTPVAGDLGKLEDLGGRALDEMLLRALLVTRGRHGLSLFERSSPSARTPRRAPLHVPIYGSDTPVDVTGAGDTVIAVFTLALSAGATYLEAAHLANYAAGMAVMKPRTATVTRAELEAVLKQEATSRR